MSKREAIRELGAVLWAWLSGQGSAAELLLAWLELATGRYPVGDEKARIG